MAQFTLRWLLLTIAVATVLLWTCYTLTSFYKKSVYYSRLAILYERSENYEDQMIKLTNDKIEVTMRKQVESHNDINELNETLDQLDARLLRAKARAEHCMH